MLGIARWRRAVVSVLAAAIFLGASGPASARHNLSVLTVAPKEVRPGAEVQVSGFSYTQPVSIRFNGLDGPVLAVLRPDSNNDIKGPVTIPADTKPGSYVLYAVQDSTGRPSRLPARGRVSVVNEGGGPVVGAENATGEIRPADLVRRDGPSTRSLVLVGFGVAGAVLFLAGIGVLLASGTRRGDEPVGERIR